MESHVTMIEDNTVEIENAGLLPDKGGWYSVKLNTIERPIFGL